MPVKTDIRVSKDSTKTLRALRGKLSTLEWLSWPVVWSPGGFTFTNGKETVVPTSHKLAETHRAINKVIEFRVVAKKLLGDLEEWRETRLAMLEKAKYVGSLGAPNFKNLIEGSKTNNQKLVPALLNLLEAETFIINSFPESPCRLLANLAPQSRTAVERFYANAMLNADARELAALSLGAIDRDSGVRPPKALATPAYRWGLDHGLTIEPTIVTKALKRKGGTNLLRKLQSHSAESISLSLSIHTIKRLLDTSADQDLLANCYTEIGKLDLLVQELSNYRQELPENAVKRRERGATLDRDSRRFTRDFNDLIEQLLNDCTSSEVLLRIHELIFELMSMYLVDTTFRDQVLKVLRAAVRIDAKHRARFLELLRKYSSRFWLPNENDQLMPNISIRKSPILELTCMLMEDCNNPQLIEICLERNVIAQIGQGRIVSEEALNLVIDIIDRLDLKTPFDVSTVCRIVRTFSDPSEAKQVLEPAIHEIEMAPFSMRSHYFETMEYVSRERKYMRASIASFTKFMPHLLPVTVDDDSENCPCPDLATCAVAISRYMPRHETDLFKALTAYYHQKKPMEYDKIDALKPGCLLGLAFIKAGVDIGDLSRSNRNDSKATQVFMEAIEIFQNHKSENNEQLLDGLRLLRDYPVFTRLIAGQYKLYPKTVDRLVERLAMAKLYGMDVLKPLDKLLRFKQAARAKRSAQHAIKRLYAKGWGELLKLTPQMVPEMFIYVLSRSITGGSQTPPTTIMQYLETPEKLQHELGYLRPIAQSLPERTDIARRVSNLEERLKEPENIIAFSANLIRKRLVTMSSDAELEAVEYVIREMFLKQLKRICGSVPNDIKIDNDLINALVLTQDVDENRRLLKKLIRAHVEDERDWRLRMPYNARFLTSLRERGIEPERWLAPFSKTYTIEGVYGGSVTIRFESDPLKILQMGNHFDTCLAFQGVNSYATVVNAIDLNKRVLYVYDKSNSVIARKLIAINQEGKLIGFRTYSNQPKGPARKQVCESVIDCVKQFAEYANLELSDEGTVPSLCSKFWYDDGVESWAPEEDVKEEDNADVARKPGRHNKL